MNVHVYLRAGFLLQLFFDLKVEVIFFSETYLNFIMNARVYITEDRILNQIQSIAIQGLVVPRWMFYILYDSIQC
jgi:hypothetical protein